MLSLFAFVLPVLFWQGGPNNAALLRVAGIQKIAVPVAQVDSWKSVPGISVEAGNLDNTVKLPAPGITFHMSEASASRVPWVNSNGWRFMRQPNARFSYDVKCDAAPLAAAEAFCYNAVALIQTDQSGLAPLGEMLKFLRTLGPNDGSPVADIGFIDDGSPISAEVMNLLVRDNLMFKIVHAPDPDLKLTVRLGSKEYPLQEAKNPDLMEHKIRANLTDARRLIRIYGTSVVVARVTGKPGSDLQIHLLNYGSPDGTRVGAFRVRVLGRYSKAQLHSFGSPNGQLTDYTPEQAATEFTVPDLKTYAVVDLHR
jgi:hypothetical protein